MTPRAHPSPLGFLRVWSRPEHGMLMRAAASLVVVSAAALAAPALLKVLLDLMARGGLDPAAAALRTGGLAAAFVVAAGAGYHAQHTLQEAGFRLRNRLRAALLSSLLARSLAFHASQRAGELSARGLDDIGRLQPVYASLFAPLLQNVLVSAGCLAMLFTLDAVAAAWLCLLFVVPFPLLLVAGRRIFRAFGAATDAHAGAGAVFTESVAAVREIRLLGIAQVRADAHAGAQERALHHERTASRVQSALQQAVFLVLTAVLLAVFHAAASGRPIAGGAGGAVAFYLYAYVLATTAAAAGRVYASWRGTAGALRRTIELLDGAEARIGAGRHAPPGPDGGAGRRMPRAAAADTGDQDPDIRCTGAVSFSGVCFSYGSGAPVLDGFTLEVPDGAWVLVRGPSGCGKSTLAALLAGLHAPDSGRILIGGRDAAALPPQAVRRAVAYVPQDPVLFSGTVRWNILLGLGADPGDTTDAATAHRYAEACRIACVDEMLAELPHGDATVVGERGFTLSGGQRTRVALARALMREVPVLVLDEVNAMLEPALEQRVWGRLLAARSARTTIVLGHHCDLVPRVDQEVVMG